MRRALLGYLVIAGLLAGCAHQSNPDVKQTVASADDRADSYPSSRGPTDAAPMPLNRAQAHPSCFPYHSAMANGPGPSVYGFAVQGAQPLYYNAPIRVVGERWPKSSSQVKLLLLPKVVDALWYGTQPGLLQCLGDRAQVLGEVSLKDGQWQWDGKLPAKAGESPVLVAIDQDGTYYLESVQLYGAPAVTKEFSLSLLDDYLLADPDGGAQLYPEEPVAVWPLLLDHPFRMAGADLPTPDGPILIHLNYADETGADWVLIGTGEVQGGRLTTEPLTIPAVLEFIGGKHATQPGTYQLIVTNDQRPFEIYLTQSIEVAPK